VLSTFFLSAGVVALAEIGDKTQLLSMMLAARFRKPLPIALGILAATLANHAAAALAGALFAGLLEGPWMSGLVGLSFLAIALWALVPDKAGEDCPASVRAFGPFLATTLCFFFAEIGDKTQVATIALAAKYQAVLAVTGGTTLGMMAANVPVVLAGSALVARLPFRAIRFGAAALFAALGGAALLSLAVG
jgi:putative Ca2+/H+ antiporter (TMEM165/GDT1 family)